MAGQVVDNSKDAVAARQFASSITSIRCSFCRQRNSITKADILRFFSSNDGEFNSSCLTCGTTTCLGCSTTITRTSEKLSNTTADGQHLVWHCDGGRLVLIWALLCGHDDQAKHNKHNTVDSPTGPQSTRSNRRGISGVGYSLDEDDDWYPNEEYLVSTHSPPRKRYKCSQSPIRTDSDDALATKVMTALTALFPAPAKQPVPTEFDKNPPAILQPLLLRSSILDKAAELLLNNSLEDATQRFALYASLLGFLRTLATGSKFTAALLHTARVRNKNGHDLFKVSCGLPTRTQDEVGAEATSKPIASYLTHLVELSQSLTDGAKNHATEFRSEESLPMLQLCTSIIECGTIVDALGISQQMDDNQSVNQQLDPDAWQKDYKVICVPDEDILNQHQYAKDAQEIASSPPGRMRRLLTELATLRTDALPPGIFIVHGESRLDVMKVVITGPRDTPYAHGLFEFDLLCGENYPEKAPSMFIRTTGRGTVGFNPNLYRDGKVCLSLLGTWHGEAWRPGKSNLAQLFISIQSMIFCADPYCNEPGQEADRGCRESKIYNLRLYPDVVRYGMLEWLWGKDLSSPPRPATLSEAQPSQTGATFLQQGGLPSQPGPYLAPTGTYVLDGELYPTPPMMLPEGLEHPPAQLIPPPKPIAKLSTKPLDLFGTVVKKHFEVNKDDITKTVREWVNDKWPVMERDASWSLPMPATTQKIASYAATVRGGKDRLWTMDTVAADAPLKEHLTKALEDLRTGAAESDFGAGGLEDEFFTS